MNKNNAGRPKSPIVYPSEPFTFSQLKGMNNLCDGTLRGALNEKIKASEIEILPEKQPNGSTIGRKRSVYKFVPKSPSTVEQSVSTEEMQPAETTETTISQ